MDERFPLQYQIACIILTALFVWSFSVSREPRLWRRLFQSTFSKATQFSVNKNKVIDESLKKWGILIAMGILVADVGCFIAGVTYQSRMDAKRMSADDWFHVNEQNRIQGTAPGAAGRTSLP
jgi:hypothetical protein